MFSVMLGLLSAPAIAAAQYAITLTGGNVTYSDSSGPHTLPYGSGSDGYGGGMGVNGAQCSGTIVAHFAWQGDPALVPDQVVIEETCVANTWTGAQPYPQTAGACSNGLGDSVNTVNSTVPINPYISLYYQSKTAGLNPDGSRIRHFTIKNNPGLGFDWPCSPSATASGNPSTCSVRYTVDYHVPSIVFTDNNVLGAGNTWRYMIGQMSTAEIFDKLGGTTTYNWSISGGNPFKNWTADQTHTTFTGMGSETGSSVTWYFKEPSLTNDVTCAVHFGLPPGSKPAAGLDMTLHRSCSSLKPSTTLTVTMNPNGVLSDGTSGMYLGGVPFPYVDANGNPQVVDCGIRWDGDIETPSDFIQARGYGGWNWIQLVTPYRTRILDGVSMGWNINGTQMLDTTFPYEPAPYTSHPGTAGTYPGDGVPRSDQDAPSQPFTPPATQYAVGDSFVTYLMYMGPGTNCRLVPLKNFKWFWKGTANKGTGTPPWTLSNKLDQWSFLGDFPTHPVWTSRADVNNVYWQ